MYLNRYRLQTAKQQRGFLIPLALFIVVVIGSLALVIARTSTQTNTASVQELLSVQTFYAAESGTQRGMQVLFFPDASDRQDADTRCVAMNQTFNFSGIVGLEHCTAQINCACLYNDNSPCAPAITANYDDDTSLPTSFYTVTTVATCGQGNYRADRTIQAGAFLEQELSP